MWSRFRIEGVRQGAPLSGQSLEVGPVVRLRTVEDFLQKITQDLAELGSGA